MMPQNSNTFSKEIGKIAPKVLGFNDTLKGDHDIGDKLLHCIVQALQTMRSPLTN